MSMLASVFASAALAAGAGPPPLRVSLADFTSVPAQAGLVTVPGTSAVVGSGPLRRFAVDVQRGVGGDPAAFAAAVQRILLDPFGWTGAGRVALQRVDSGVVDLRVTLASPRMTDRLCFPLHTAGFADCFNRGRAVINVDRWTQGSVSYAGDLADYRDYLVGHEFGHGLGHGHKHCPGPGRRSFLMMQQTGTTFGCRRQPWPRVSEQRQALVPPRVVVVPGPSAAELAGVIQELAAPDRRLDVRTLAGPAALSAGALRGAAALVFLDTASAPTPAAAVRRAGQPLADAPTPAPAVRRAVQRFVRTGGGVVAVGSAVASFPDWAWWRRLVAGSPPTRCRLDGKARIVVDGAVPVDWSAAPQQALVAGGLAWVLGLSERRPCA
jgi:hypothetical protein